MTTKTILTRLALTGIAATLALTAVGAAPATAAMPARPLPALSPAIPPSVLIIMDGSGSMRRTDASGVSLVDGAKQAVRDLIGTLPETARVGLRVYGTEVAGNDKATGCRDTKLVAPVATLDKPRLQAAVEDIKAVGFTPIGYSLRQAAKDLPSNGKRTIVLVSDGEDTCTPPDPCAVARELRADGVDVTIDSVGLRLDSAAAKTQLTCISKATGGTYRDASGAAELGSQLKLLGGRALRQAEVGTPIEGRPSALEAPTLTPGTLYTDSILPAEKLFYAVDVQPGQSVRTQVTVAPAGSPDDQRSLLAVYSDASGRPGGTNFLAIGQRLNAAQSGSGVSEVATAANAGRWVVGVESRVASATKVADFEASMQLQVDLVGTPTPPSSSPTATASTPGSDATVATDTGNTADGSGTPGWLVALVVLLVLAVAGLVTALVLMARRARAARTS